MDDKKFKKIDEKMMRKMEPLRSKEVSDAMLKGFSASVERRISAEPAVREKAPARLVWAPAAVMAVFALFVVFKTPVQTGWQLSPTASPIELAQLVSEEEIQEEIALLSELGALDETGEEQLLFEEEMLLSEEIELSQKTANLSLIG